MKKAVKCLAGHVQICLDELLEENPMEYSMHLILLIIWWCHRQRSITVEAVLSKIFIKETVLTKDSQAINLKVVLSDSRVHERSFHLKVVDVQVRQVLVVKPQLIGGCLVEQQVMFLIDLKIKKQWLLDLNFEKVLSSDCHSLLAILWLENCEA